MLPILLNILIALVYTPVNGRICKPRDLVSHALEEAPDAKKLIKRTDWFFLVYHSKNESFRQSYPCLQAARRDFDRKAWTATYEIAYLSDKKLASDHRQVSLDKTDDAYPSKNEFAVDLSKDGDKIIIDFQIIYSDYSSCVLFWSWDLGYQVWVEGSYLKRNRKVPWPCELLYQLLADSQKHIVYNQKSCVIRERIKNS